MRILSTVLFTTETLVKIQENHFIQGKKLKHNHIGNVSSYKWQEDACLKKLDETNDLEKMNFSDMAREFQLLNENGKKVVISLLICIFSFMGVVFNSIFAQSQ